MGTVTLATSSTACRRARRVQLCSIRSSFYAAFMFPPQLEHGRGPSKVQRRDGCTAANGSKIGCGLSRSSLPLAGSWLPYLHPNPKEWPGQGLAMKNSHRQKGSASVHAHPSHCGERLADVGFVCATLHAAQFLVEQCDTTMCTRSVSMSAKVTLQRMYTTDLVVSPFGSDWGFPRLALARKSESL